MFLHGGFLHIFGNMLFLAVFGPNVEDAMTRPRYLVFYLLGGIVALAAQVAVSPNSTGPTLGASGAIAAVLGGYILLYPRARVITLIFIIFFFTIVELPASSCSGSGSSSSSCSGSPGRRTRWAAKASPTSRTSAASSSAWRRSAPSPDAGPRPAAGPRPGSHDRPAGAGPMRTAVLAIALVFIAGFAFLTVVAATEQGVTVATVLSVFILVLLAVGIVGALRNPPGR